jgi:hypothetical protein
MCVRVRVCVCVCVCVCACTPARALVVCFCFRLVAHYDRLGFFAEVLPIRGALLYAIHSLQKRDPDGVFAHPVNPSEAPGYAKMITRSVTF